MEAKSKFWQKVLDGGTNLYEPGALAGWGPFHLPKDHWLNNAAQPHDGWYNAKERGEVPPEAKGKADCIFLITAFLDARNEAEKRLNHAVHLPGPIPPEEWQIWEDCAQKFTEACLAYLTVRGPVGELAWNT